MSSACVRAKFLQSCPTVCSSVDCSPTGLLCPWDSPGKNTEVGCRALLQGIFPTQGSDPSLLNWQADSLPLGFPDSSVGKESTCSAGDPRSIPELGRSSGERIGYPLWYWGFPCGSSGKESTCNVGELGSIPGLEDSLEKGKATYSSVMAWRILWTWPQRVGHDWVTHNSLPLVPPGKPQDVQ